jgi:hypothetical protein
MIHDAPKTLIELPCAMKIARQGLRAYFETLALGQMPDPESSILFLEDYFAQRRIVVRSDLPEGLCPADPDDYLAGHRALALLVIMLGQELSPSFDLPELNAVQLRVEQRGREMPKASAADVQVQRKESVMTAPAAAHPICPRCGGFIPNNHEPGAYRGALSRVDNKTEVCSDCGTEEAYEPKGLDGLTRDGRKGWPS